MAIAQYREAKLGDADTGMSDAPRYEMHLPGR